MSKNAREEVSFEEMELIRDVEDTFWNPDTQMDEKVMRRFRVTLEWIGEGRSGEYNPDDSHDEPYIRFNCDIFRPDQDGNMESGDWESIDDASYCTGLSAFDTKETLTKAINRIMDVLVNNYNCSGFKKEMESISWIEANDFITGN